MKKLIATILLSLPLAASADMMVMPNQQGGHIILVKDECPLEHDKTTPLYMALTTSDTVTIPGCWFFKDMLVHIFWFQQGQNPVKHEYPVEHFKFVPEKQENKSNS